MAEFKGKELTPALIRKAMACNSAEDVLALAKENGIEITREEAEAYLEEISGSELSDDLLEMVSGGDCYAADDPTCPENVTPPPRQV